MKIESPLATLAATVLGAAACPCGPPCCVTAASPPSLSRIRRSTERQPPAPAQGAASVVLWRHLRAEFAASEATEGRLTWFVWSAGLVTIGCFLAAML